MGVNFSIAFSNWNENRKKHSLEIEILEEIRQDLQEDLKDATSIRKMHLNQKKAFGIFNKHLKEHKPINDTLSLALESITGFSFFNRNQVAYENYKYRGVEIIQNDTLRIHIMKYYEEQLEWYVKNEDFVIQFQDQYLNPLLFQNFDFYPKITPLDYNKLMTDRRAIQIFILSEKAVSNMVILCEEIITNCQKLDQYITQEINRLS